MFNSSVYWGVSIFLLCACRETYAVDLQNIEQPISRASQFLDEEKIIEKKYPGEQITSITRMVQQIKACLDAGVQPQKISAIFDVDGTLTDRADPTNYQTGDEVKPRGAAVELIKWLLELKINVIFSSAWHQATQSDPLAGFKQTLERLESLGLGQSGAPMLDSMALAGDQFSVMSCDRAVSVKRNGPVLPAPVAESRVLIGGFGFGPSKPMGFGAKNTPKTQDSPSGVGLESSGSISNLSIISPWTDPFYRQKAYALYCYDKEIAKDTEVIFFADDSAGNINQFVLDFKKIRQDLYPNTKKLYIYVLGNIMPQTENWDNILQSLNNSPNSMGSPINSYVTTDIVQHLEELNLGDTIPSLSASREILVSSGS